jgi:hypothetical protein
MKKMMFEGTSRTTCRGACTRVTLQRKHWTLVAISHLKASLAILTTHRRVQAAAEAARPDLTDQLQQARPARAQVPLAPPHNN